MQNLRRYQRYPAVDYLSGDLKGIRHRFFSQVWLIRAGKFNVPVVQVGFDLSLSFNALWFLGANADGILDQQPEDRGWPNSRAHLCC